MLRDWIAETARGMLAEVILADDMVRVALSSDSRARLDEAKALYERVLRGQEEQLGPGHPDALRTVGSIAAIEQSVEASIVSFPGAVIS